MGWTAGRERPISNAYTPAGRRPSKLIAEYRVDYLVLGPHERAFMAAAAEPLGRYPLVAEHGPISPLSHVCQRGELM